ncbi:MAG: pentapeptide repeat-containing protein [Desulfococcaceae bacterium]
MTSAPPAAADGLKALQSELALGATGVFAVICPDADCREVCRQFELKEAPGRARFRLDLTEIDADPSMLEPRSAPAEGRLVQVLGIEHLTEAARMDLMGRLQGLLLHPADVVLVWMPAAFERQLFFLAPELHAQILGSFDLTPSGAEVPARSRKKPPALPPEAVNEYFQTLIHQYENWAETRRSGHGFLIPEMATVDLRGGYRPTFFANKQGKQFLLDDLLDRFAADPNLNFLGVLGGVGSGKTAFALHYFVERVRRFLAAPEAERMPVFLSLAGISGRLNVEAHLIDRFEACFGVRLSVIALQDLLLRGRFFFFVDGFDEMGSAEDRFLTETHLEAISRLAMKNVLLEDGLEKPQPANKVALTSRPHYFLADAAGGLANFSPLYREYAASGNFQLVHLLPKRFSDPEDFRKFVVHALGDGIAARNLLGLAGRAESLVPVPLLREMIARTVPIWRDRDEVGLADLFRAYTDLWRDRDDWRSRLTAEGRGALLRRMALRMVSGENTPRLSGDRLPAPSEAHVKETRGGGADPSAESLATCEFVSRDETGAFGFVHPAFAHFFCAESCLDRIRKGGENPVPHEKLGPDVRGFLAAILSGEKGDLERLPLSGVHLEGANLYQANLRSARLDRAALSGAVLMNANLAGADLTAADLSNGRLTRADLSDVDLSGANLTGARLRDADLSGARLNGADLRGADLRGARMRGVRAAWVDFHEADLTGADLSNAILSDAVMAGVRLSGVRLKGAHASGANFSGADLSGADAVEADLSGADLSGANLSGVNFTWANLEAAIFTGANLQEAKLRESNLERAALTGVTARRADFRLARMAGARMAEAVLREADFSQAVMKRVRLDRADLSWALLNETRLDGAELANARLNMAKLMDAFLVGARLSGADLTWADLSRADLTGADLSETNLSEADLSNAKLVGARMENAVCRETTFSGADLADAVNPPAVCFEREK